MPSNEGEFTISMTNDQATQAAELLASIGVAFDPADSMMETDPEDHSYWLMRSRDTDHLISAINDRLEEFYPGCSVPDPVGLEQTREALRLAYWEFDWHNRRPSADLWRMDDGSWREVMDKYPALFGQRSS